MRHYSTPLSWALCEATWGRGGMCKRLGAFVDECRSIVAGGMRDVYCGFQVGCEEVEKGGRRGRRRAISREGNSPIFGVQRGDGGMIA